MTQEQEPKDTTEAEVQQLREELQKAKDSLGQVNSLIETTVYISQSIAITGGSAELFHTTQKHLISCLQIIQQALGNRG